MLLWYLFKYVYHKNYISIYEHYITECILKISLYNNISNRMMSGRFLGHFANAVMPQNSSKCVSRGANKHDRIQSGVNEKLST